MHAQPEQRDRVDSGLFRSTLGAFATGVTVVTVGGASPHGMTANSLTSVSLDPPLVLVCVRRDAIMHELLLRGEMFGVSILAAAQEATARHFADSRRPLGRKQFEAVEWSPGAISGAPLIAGAAAWMECEVRRLYDGGDHTIFLASPLWMQRRPDAGVLLFLHGRFRRLDRGHTT